MPASAPTGLRARFRSDRRSRSSPVLRRQHGLSSERSERHGGQLSPPCRCGGDHRRGAGGSAVLLQQPRDSGALATVDPRVDPRLSTGRLEVRRGYAAASSGRQASGCACQRGRSPTPTLHWPSTCRLGAHRVCPGEAAGGDGVRRRARTARPCRRCSRDQGRAARRGRTGGSVVSEADRR